MISIVICSINAGYLSKVKESISSTIGVAYELLIWDNLAESKGICEVYNSMAEKAKFDYICFLHEDIIFETENWGSEICSVFLDRNDIGVIGVAGSKYKSSFFSGWYTGIKELDCANIIHRYATGDDLVCLKPEPANNLEEVACIDGVFICCRKQLWHSIRFDQQNLSGFHFYDIDFSTRAAAICTIAVTYNILMVHVTKGGDFGDKWVKVAIQYHLLAKEKLPLQRIKQIGKETDIAIIKTWLDVLKNYRISWNNKMKWIRQQHLLRYPGLMYSILKFLVYKPLGLRYIHKTRKRK